MKHLGSYDHRLFHFDTFADQHTLDARYLLGRHFDTQVTTGNHHAVSDFQDLFHIVDPFLVFDLSDNLDRAVVFVQDTLDIHHVLLVADKRVSDEIQIVSDRPYDIFTVFLCQGRQIDAYTRHVHALTASQGCVVLHFANQKILFLFDYFQFQISVIDQDIATDAQVIDKIPVRDTNTIMRSLSFRVSHDLNNFPGLKRDRSLRSSRTDIINDSGQTFLRHMSRIEAHDIHSCLVQRVDKLDLATLVGNCSNNLRML